MLMPKHTLNVKCVGDIVDYGLVSYNKLELDILKMHNQNKVGSTDTKDVHTLKTCKFSYTC